MMDALPTIEQVEEAFAPIIERAGRGELNGLFPGGLQVGRHVHVDDVDLCVRSSMEKMRNILSNEKLSAMPLWRGVAEGRMAQMAAILIALPAEVPPPSVLPTHAVSGPQMSWDFVE